MKGKTRLNLTIRQNKLKKKPAVCFCFSSKLFCFSLTIYQKVNVTVTPKWSFLAFGLLYLEEALHMQCYLDTVVVMGEGGSGDARGLWGGGG